MQKWRHFRPQISHTCIFAQCVSMMNIVMIPGRHVAMYCHVRITTLTYSFILSLHEGSTLVPFPFLITSPIIFGTIGGIAGALCLYAIIYWPLFGCVCFLRRRCHKSSPIDPGDSYSPHLGGSVRCNSDALYSPAFGVSGAA